MITRAHRSRAVAAIAAILLLTAGTACADEITVLTSGAFKAAYLELAPQLERAAGHHLVTEATSIPALGSTSRDRRLGWRFDRERRSQTSVQSRH